MSGARDISGKVAFSPRVLQQIDKENIQTSSAFRGRTPDTRRKLGAIKLFTDETSTVSTSTPRTPASSYLGDAINQAEAQIARYKEERRQAIVALSQESDKVLDLKAAAASTNERYTALLKNHEEANKELALLRTQLASGNSGNSGSVERLKMAVESLEASNELLREERGSLAARLAKREAACATMKDELTAMARQDKKLHEELELAQEELKKAAETVKERDRALAETGGQDFAEWKIQKAALEAQVQELEQQFTAAGHRCASVVAERAVMVEESARQAREHEIIVAELQDELRSLHRRTSADLGDWQRRHREAIAARKAVEGQLERMLAAGKSISAISDQQAALERSLKEACDLLYHTVQAEVPRKGAADKGIEVAQEDEVGPAAAERAVEGILEHVLGRVFEASHTNVEDKKPERNDEEAREREAEHELRRDALTTLGRAFDQLTEEMDALRNSGDVEANLHLEQERQVMDELQRERERHETAISKLEAGFSASQREIEQLTQRVADGDKERKELEMQLEATVQLSEMALAARVKAGDGDVHQEASSSRKEVECSTHQEARSEELEAERQAFVEKVNTLEVEKRALHQRAEGLAAEAAILKAQGIARCPHSPDRKSPRSRDCLPGDSGGSEDRLQSIQSRLRAVLAKNAKLEQKMADLTAGGVRESRISVEKPTTVAALEAEVERLRGSLEAERAHLEEVKLNDRVMRKYLVEYHRRSQLKMKEMQRRLACATEGQTVGSC